MAELSVKHKKFIDEYLKHGVGSRAVIAAGMSANGASVTANRFLKDPNIAAEITRRRSVSEKKAQLSAEMVLNELKNLVVANAQHLFDDKGELIPIHLLPPDVAATIASVEMGEKGCGIKKLRQHSKLGAIELAAKLLGMVRDQQAAQASVQIILAAPPELPAPVSQAMLRPEW